MTTPILFLALAMAIALLAQLWAVVWARAAVRDLDDDIETQLVYMDADRKHLNALQSELRAGICAAKNTDVLHGAQLRGAGERIRTLEAEVAALNKTVETMIQGSNQ